MNNKISRLLITLTIFSTCGFSDVRAQTEDEQFTNLILQKDSLFWMSYNNCDIARNRDFFFDDVEFYHDKGGLTQGVQALSDALKNNLCSNPDFRLRRAAVPGTVKVYLLRNANVIYGAIISGDHIFYVLETGKKEQASGMAKFTHLWLLKKGDWKMARILSFDHGPLPLQKKSL